MGALSSRRLSVVVPTLNERASIGELLERVDSLFEGGAEIIVSDGGSRDGTCEAVENFAKAHPKTRLLSNRENPGLTASVLHGFDVATGEYLACIDGDMQHDEGSLAALFDALASGAAMVVGTRHSSGGRLERGWPLWRRLASWAACCLALPLTKGRTSDPMSGCFALRRDAYALVRPALNQNAFKVMLEILCKLLAARPDAEIREVGIVFHLQSSAKPLFRPRKALNFILMLFSLLKR